jgi:hypothetical protein
VADNSQVAVGCESLSAKMHIYTPGLHMNLPPIANNAS